MPNLAKIISRLGVKDISKHPVWEFENQDTNARSDRRIRPIVDLPVKSLAGRLVGTQVQLASGEMRWAVLSNITLTNPKKSAHFLTAWIEDHGQWFELARYFDVDYRRRGPEQLAQFLGMGMAEVFPISYDISSLAEGPPGVLRGHIDKDPHERLTEDEIVALAIAKD